MSAYLKPLTSGQAHYFSRYGWTIIAAIAGLVAFAIHLTTFPDGIDFASTFEPTVTAWLHGQAIYTAPHHGFFNAPWLVLAYLPLLWLGYKGAQAALTLITLFGLFAGWRIFARPQGLTGWQKIGCALLCLVNLHTFDLIFRGQIDVFVMAGLIPIYLGLRHRQPDLLGIGWVMALVRPTSILLIIGYSLLMAWHWRIFWRALLIPLISFGLSLILFGFDWPIHWYDQIAYSAPPRPGPWSVTWVHVASYLQVDHNLATVIMLFFLLASIWIMVRYRPSLMLSMALLGSASLLTVPYVLSYHYPVLMCVFIPPLIKWKGWLGWPLLVLTLTPLLRLNFGLEIAWIDIVLPLFAWVLLWMRIVSLRRAEQPIAAMPITV